MLPARARERWTRVFQALSDLRAGKPARQVFRDAGITPEQAYRWAPTAFRRQANGRIVARPTDRLLRVLYLPDGSVPGGKREIATRDSNQATVIAEYWHALARYLYTGNATALRAFSDRVVIASNGQAVPLLTDTTMLRRLGNAGVLSFQTIYSR